MKMRRFPAGFSLTELLIVIVIIAIIAGFAIPSASNMLKSSQMTQASSLLTDTMTLARQTAITKNRQVEVRFYRYSDNEIPGEEVDKPEKGHFRAFQTFEFTESGIVIPASQIFRLPDSIIMNPGIPGDGILSTLLGEDRATPAEDPPSIIVTKDEINKDVDPELPRGVGHRYEYVAFRFMPDGSTSLPPNGMKGGASEGKSGGLWYVTIHSIGDWERLKSAGNEEPPPNYFTWMVDPTTGTSKTFKPGIVKKKSGAAK